MKTRAKGMDYGTYKAMCAAKGTQPLDEDAFKALPVAGDGDDDSPNDGGDEGGDEGGDDAPPENEDEDEAEKSVPLGDLRKALSAFDDVVSAAGTAVGGSRETYLTARLKGGSITKSERAELGRLWSGSEPNAATDPSGRPLRKSLTEYLDPENREVVDAQPILKSLVSGLQERLDVSAARGEANTESLRQILGAQNGLFKAMSGAILHMGEQLTRRDAVIKALEARLGIVERTPAAPRAVRAAGAAGAAPRPLAKSTTGGGPPPANELRKSIIRGFHTLVKGAGDGGDFGTAARLTEECAVFERTGHLQPGTKAAIRAISA